MTRRPIDLVPMEDECLSELMMQCRGDIDIPSPPHQQRQWKSTPTLDEATVRVVRVPWPAEEATPMQVLARSETFESSGPAVADRPARVALLRLEDPSRGL